MLKMTTRRWWSSILLCAALLRLTGFTFGLPYFENVDEPWFFYEAAFQRGLIGSWLHPNPSQGLIGLYKGAQIIAEALTGGSALQHVSAIVTAMRLLSIIVSLITLVFIGLAARELSRDNRAGWLAAALWAVIPLVVYHSFIAIAEPWMMLLAAVALWTGAAALRREQPAWPLVSVWAGLAAFLFKYSMFPFAGVGVAVALWRLAIDSHRGKWARVLTFQAISIGLFFIALIAFGGLVGDVNNPSREMALFFQNPFAKLSDLNAIWNIVAAAFYQIGLAPAIFAALFIAGLLLARGSAARFGWLLFGALGLFCAVLVVLYLMIDLTLLRYLFPACLIFTILAACSAVALWEFTAKRVGSARRGLPIVAAVLLMVWYGPLARQSALDAVQRTLPYTLKAMTEWASATLGEGAIITEGLGHRAFTHEMGGYTGPNRDYIYGVDVLSQSSDAWKQAGYRYIEMIPPQVQTLRQTTEGSQFLDQLTELRRFPPADSSGAWNGPAFVVYALDHPERQVSGTFGSSIALKGVSGIRDSFRAGDTLSLRFFWNAYRTPDNNYSLFIHLTGDDRTRLLAQADGTPGPARRPTLTWNEPEETLVSDLFTLTIPADILPGTYHLWIGIYDPVSGTRLSTGSGTDMLLTDMVIRP